MSEKKKIELLRVGEKDLETRVVKRASSNKRDIMVHAAVTICDTVQGVRVFDSKEHEVCQFAGSWEAQHVPVPELHVRQAFREMEQRCIERMRLYGLIK